MTQRRATSLSPPEMFWLRVWGRLLRDAFGAMPYLVGSAARAEVWRDIDVRMMLAADDPLLADRHHRLRVLHVAISLWGQKTTGLPIDFQFQAAAEANAEHPGRRIPIGMDDHPRRMS